MQMVDAMERSGALSDSRVAAAARKVPREVLLPEGFADQAYLDVPLALELGSFEPSPLVQVAMVQAARVGGEQRVLDLEPGQGYRAALCAMMGARVYCLVGSPNDQQTLQTNLRNVGLANVTVELGQEATGLPRYAEYNVLFGCWTPRDVPDTIKDQVRNQGRFVLLPKPGRDRIEVLKSQKTTLSPLETINVGLLSHKYQTFLSSAR